MIKISDFNSLWEITFAVNAIFVYFELVPVLENKFKGIAAIGSSIIDKMMEEQDRRYINTYGWRNVLFGYAIWVSRLKLVSVFNSLISILLIIVAGFYPESGVGVLFVTITSIILFTPIFAIPAILVFGLPYYKMKCIERAVSDILERERGDLKIQNRKARRYTIAVEYIKMTDFAIFPFVKRDKAFSDQEILDEVGE